MHMAPKNKPPQSQPPPVVSEKDVVFGTMPAAHFCSSHPLLRAVLSADERTGTSEDGTPLLLDIWRPLPANTEGDGLSGEANTHSDRGGKTSAAVLWIHGGGWKSGNKSHIPACMLPVIAQGLVVASVGYRKSSVAGNPSLPAKENTCRKSASPPSRPALRAWTNTHTISTMYARVIWRTCGRVAFAWQHSAQCECAKG
jgi:acetyl esterase/lipase